VKPGSNPSFAKVSIPAFSDQLSAAFMSSIALGVDMRHALEQTAPLHQLKEKPLLFRLRKETWGFFALKILANYVASITVSH
jgi:hypothetical protein